MKRFRVALVAMVAGVVAVAACRDAGPTAPASTLTAAEASRGSGSLRGLPQLLACAPLPESQSRDWFGPEGGVLQIGPHTLRIPPGALSKRTRIDGHVKPEDVNRVDLQPHGLVFNKPVQLTMSYANCTLPAILAPKSIAYTTQTLQILELLPSADDLAHKRVTSPLQHFSDYAVAW